MSFARLRIRRLWLFLLLAGSVGLASSPVACAQVKIGTVDVQRVFRASEKAQAAQAKLNAAKNAATKEFTERTDAYKKALDEINRLNQQLDTPALSPQAKAQKVQLRDVKIEGIKKLERELTEFRQTRERQLQEQMLRMKEAIVQEITGVVLGVVKAKKLDLVFDKSGASLSGFSPVLYARPSDDLTDEVIAGLKAAAHSP